MKLLPAVILAFGFVLAPVIWFGLTRLTTEEDFQGSSIDSGARIEIELLRQQIEDLQARTGALEKACGPIADAGGRSCPRRSRRRRRAADLGGNRRRRSGLRPGCADCGSAERKPRTAGDWWSISDGTSGSSARGSERQLPADDQSGAERKADDHAGWPHSGKHAASGNRKPAGGV
ncbi:hypothetical protein GQR58_030475 [Nymphon striatum]|nr:hypothetical protein GQR58_030475 [Nymphon striatum]